MVHECYYFYYTCVKEKDFQEDQMVEYLISIRAS